MFFPVLLFTLVSFILLGIIDIINVDFILSTINSNYFIYITDDPNSIKGSLNLRAENLSTTVDASKYNNSINKFIEGIGKPNNDNTDFVISSLDLEQLNLDFYLHLVMLYLFVILFVIVIMKNISKRNLKFEFVRKLPFGDYLQILLIKLFNWWDKTNDVWIYLILITVFISLIISAWSIYIIISNIH